MTPPRRDWALILARGDSSRMGVPKGLCTVPGGTDTFIARICSLYRDRGFPTAVVTLHGLRDGYAEAAGPGTVAEWIVHPPGGGTAESCLAGADRLAGRATHLWLHPVDLPLVAPAVLEALARISAAAPDEILIPRHGDRRGHPVVLPLAPWLVRAGVERAPEAMRDLIVESGEPFRYVETVDPGIHTDFDTPEDLA